MTRSVRQALARAALVSLSALAAAPLLAQSLYDTAPFSADPKDLLASHRLTWIVDWNPIVPFLELVRLPIGAMTGNVAAAVPGRGAVAGCRPRGTPG